MITATVVGRICSVPELTQHNETDVLNMRVVSVRPGQNSEDQRQTVCASVWGPRAVRFHKQLRRGDAVALSGTLELEIDRHEQPLLVLRVDRLEVIAS